MVEGQTATGSNSPNWMVSFHPLSVIPDKAKKKRKKQHRQPLFPSAWPGTRMIATIQKTMFQCRAGSPTFGQGNRSEADTKHGKQSIHLKRSITEDVFYTVT
mgnify:CR=1 FL=1